MGFWADRASPVGVFPWLGHEGHPLLTQRRWESWSNHRIHPLERRTVEHPMSQQLQIVLHCSQLLKRAVPPKAVRRRLH